MRWKALGEIYTTHSFAPFFKLNISAKNRQHFFREWIMIFRFVHFLCRIFYFSENFRWNFVRIWWQIPEKSYVRRFFNRICENKLENCRKFWNLKIVNFGRAWAGYGCRKCFESAVKREIRRSVNSWKNTSVVLFKCNQNSSCFVGSASSYVQFELSHNGSHDTRL